jgi:hypothetical protein
MPGGFAPPRVQRLGLPDAGIWEAIMMGLGRAGRPLWLCFLAASLAALANPARGQDARRAAASSDSAPAQPAAASADEVRALSDLVRGLQDQVQALNDQLTDLRREQERSSAEARDLRRELDAVRAQGGSAPSAPFNPYGPPPANRPTASPVSAASTESAQGRAPDNRISTLEEQEEVLEGKIDDQYQSKIESGSKYRLRLSGIVLLNLIENHGTLDTMDFPSFSESLASQGVKSSPNAFTGTLRQSQIRLQAFGPDVGGARTSADVNIDFAGGFVANPNGAVMGIPRFRTGTVRFDWANTSIVAGQDRLFFAPISPTSMATIAIPPLSYAGDLWAWVPQVRIEHRMVLSDSSSLSIQGGILDNVSGDLPNDPISRYPLWGEQSGQPAYATRIAWSHSLFGQHFTIGAAGYYTRQDWGFNRSVDGWAGITDVTLPLGKRWEFSGEFYRGRAVAGLGGGIGQSVVPNGDFLDPATVFRGLDSLGGWAQLKYRVKPNFEINAAFGTDNPYAGELRRAFSTFYQGEALNRNISPFANFIYQIRSDILFSVEYQYFDTTQLDWGSNRASHVNVSLGYVF